MKCSRCQSLTFTKLTGTPELRDKDSFVAILHQTRASFNEANSDGCDFCILLSHQLGDREPGVSDKLCASLDAFMVLKCGRLFPTSLRLEGKRETIFVRSRLGAVTLDVVEDLPGKDPPAAPPSEREKPNVNQPQEKYHRQSTSQDDSTGSSENLQLASLWLNNCRNNENHHQSCKQFGNEGTTPTRLINVENPTRPFLETTSHTNQDPYIALSYSWGLGPKFSTVKANVEAHKTGIPIDKLAQNFKDAIRVAHKLGYKYLWTDALCIVQDCEDCLGYEIPRMGDIYRFADLTIYAERAAGAGDGLFEKRKVEACRPVEVEWTFSRDDGDVSRKFTLAPRRDGINFLENRGWIFQEEILSSRLLIFGRQLKWWCKECVAEETNPQPRKAEYDGKRIGVERFRKNLLERKHGVSERHYFETWYAVVEEYSKRKLKFDCDTLKALDGLATRFTEVHGGLYIQGLWNADVHYGLGWFTAVDRRSASRTGMNIAPSWSWASVGKVNISFVTQKAAAKDRTGEDIGPGPRWGVFQGTRALERRLDIASHELHFHGRLEKLTLCRDLGLESQKTNHPNYVRPTRASRNNDNVMEPTSKRRKPSEKSFVWFNARFPALIINPATDDYPTRIGEAALDTCQAELEPTEFLTLPLFWVEIRDQLLGVCLLVKEAGNGTGNGTVVPVGETANGASDTTGEVACNYNASDTRDNGNGKSSDKETGDLAVKNQQLPKYRRVGIALVENEHWLEKKINDEAVLKQQLVII